jgi:hypothetical protein
MHTVCRDHSDPEVLFRAFGWTIAFISDASCAVCPDLILAEVYTLQAEDLAEVSA